MSDLPDFLSQYLKRRDWTFDVAEENTGVPKATLHNIINKGQNPTPETLVKISRGFSLPLWRVMELAGYDLGLDQSTLAQQVASLMDAIPGLKTVFGEIRDLDEASLSELARVLRGFLYARQDQPG